MRSCLVPVAAAAWLCWPAVYAHHAFTANFDVEEIVEVEGRITALHWQNPHVLMTLAAPGGVEWQVESQAKNLLERTEIEPGMFAPGTQVALAGYPARQGNGIFALNALLPDGREVILRAGIASHFGGRSAGRPDNILETGVADAGSSGIFRVWSMQFAGDGRWRWPGSYPLTPAAAEARDRFDPKADNPLANCGKKGMPWIMEQPFPMELAMDGGDIVMRIEEDDAVRVIHMGAAPAAAMQPSPLGYSVGRWDGDDLVVETRAIDYPYLNSTGIPLSGAAMLHERFSPAADGSRLTYRLTITDPANFTEPVTINSYWVWWPGQRLQRYACVPEN
jgi:hypothetical protein